MLVEGLCGHNRRIFFSLLVWLEGNYSFSVNLASLCGAMRDTFGGSGRHGSRCLLQGEGRPVHLRPMHDSVGDFVAALSRVK